MNARDYERIAAAIRFIQDRVESSPSLEAIAGSAGLSPFHFERLFKRWAGTTPKRFLQCLRVEHAKRLLREPGSLLDTGFGVGLSSPSRLHDLFCSLEALSPGEYRRGGEGVKIRYGLQPTPFGSCSLAITDRGICHLAFVDGDRAAPAVALAKEWPRAELIRDPAATRRLGERIFEGKNGARGEPFHLLVRGTNFQVQVWRGLLAIPPDRAVSYRDVARELGCPASVRPVAGAVAANPIAYLIPCHRVLRASGAIGGYRWGVERKRALLAWESASQVRNGDERVASEIWDA